MTIESVDASFQRGIDRALRALSDRDVLDTTVRYLDRKHAADA